MSSTERPAKRVRQACDPCRRKKSRCPGEKPVCSYCARLGQQCTYLDEGLNARRSISELEIHNIPLASAHPLPPQQSDHDASATAQRLDELEKKLSEVLAALHESRGRESLHTRSNGLVPQLTQPQPSESAASLNAIPSTHTTNEVVSLYLKYCHCQPLPLFDPDGFEATFDLRTEEVRLVVAAMSSRFSSQTAQQLDRRLATQSDLQRARNLTMQRLNTGVVELSTLQSLCLLSWLDFYDGNTHRASMYTSLASDLCKSSNIASNSIHEHVQDEKLRCFWSIVLLQRLHPNISGSFHVSFEDENLPPYPTSSLRPPNRNDFTVVRTESRYSEHKDLGIVAYAIQLTEVWYMAIRYAHRRASGGQYPPWSSKSDYAKIIAHQMDSETTMPYSKHRFKPAKFEERTSEELSEHRHYWGPWLFTQILYHTIICVLNHPLLLSLRLRAFRVASIPEIWLQHADDLITQHISDPFIAHCVAIVATIHLQQSFGGNDESRLAKRDSFAKCLHFCQKMGERWPYIQQIAQKLQDFERIVSNSYLNSSVSQARDKVFIDLSLFWEILESAGISDTPDSNGLRFGHSLQRRTPRATTAEELNTRLLPEPARVAAASPANGSNMQQTSRIASDAVLRNNSHNLSGAGDDFSVLAQSYFAQGQDFVGNMDDWWLMDLNPTL